MIDRRAILAGGLSLGFASIAGVTLSATPEQAKMRALTRSNGNKRMLAIILRGAADGLSIAAPVGDPGYGAVRGPWASQHQDGLKLDSTFTLHPTLKNFGKLYRGGEALVGHALATSYRDRSHFDGQNILESGGLKPYERSDGFLNRFIGLMRGGELPALTLTQAIPLILRGSNAVTSYAPEPLGDTNEILEGRISQLYAADPQLLNVWQAAQAARLAAAGASDGDVGPRVALGRLAAQMMDAATPSDLVVIDLAGWDSHSGQEHILTRNLTGLDALLGAFQTAVGNKWKDTLVAIFTEFGRTAAINGTGGTDHGTAGAALLLGGSVRGGRVVADWPGLAPSQLYQGRDLKPTNSVEAFLSGAMAEHFGLDPVRTFETMFPGRNQKAMSGLVV